REQDVTKITLVCTHGLFSGQALERLTAFPELQEIVTTNTVPIPPEKRVKNMTVLSIAPIFGEAILRNLKGQSLNPLFSY
ncbi:MAG: ribose-phosphate pyrophosphokinase, partial [Anaerolineae bacterium]